MSHLGRTLTVDGLLCRLCLVTLWFLSVPFLSLTILFDGSSETKVWESQRSWMHVTALTRSEKQHGSSSLEKAFHIELVANSKRKFYLLVWSKFVSFARPFAFYIPNLARASFFFCHSFFILYSFISYLLVVSFMLSSPSKQRSTFLSSSSLYTSVENKIKECSHLNWINTAMYNIL